MINRVKEWRKKCLDTKKKNKEHITHISIENLHEIFDFVNWTNRKGYLRLDDGTWILDIDMYYIVSNSTEELFSTYMKK